MKQQGKGEKDMPEEPDKYVINADYVKGEIKKNHKSIKRYLIKKGFNYWVWSRLISKKNTTISLLGALCNDFNLNPKYLIVKSSELEEEKEEAGK